MKATVTNQHPIYKDVFTTLYNGKRYDVNITTGRVWHMVQVGTGFRNFEVKTDRVISAVTKAVKELENN